jgi:hypothetical protein
MILKCNCNVCNEHLEFDDADAGKTITCPHCQMETVLYVPKVSARPPTHVTPPKLKITSAPTKSTGVLLVLLAIGSAVAFLLNQQVKALNRLAEKAAAPRWSYKVVACDDDAKRMDAYSAKQRKAGEISEAQYLMDISLHSEYENGRFDMLDVSPGEDWELAAHFLEPVREHPKLILIFKRPL